MNSIATKATSYIKEELKRFILLFPQTRIRYEYDLDADVHSVEIIPNQVYHSNNNYIDWENKFTDVFIDLFPNQNICFISDDAIVGIDTIQFELVGTQFVDIILINITKQIISSAPINFSNSNRLLNIDKISTSKKVFNSSITTNKITNSNTYTDSANSLNCIEDQNQNQDLFMINFSMAA